MSYSLSTYRTTLVTLMPSPLVPVTFNPKVKRTDCQRINQVTYPPSIARQVAYLQEAMSAQKANAPSNWSFSTALRVYDEVAREAAPEELQLVMDVEGGVAVYIYSKQMLKDGAHARYVIVSICNDGCLTVGFTDRQRRHFQAKDASIHTIAADLAPLLQLLNAETD